MNDVEATGEVVTGIAAARAVEPRHGEATTAAAGGMCLNCGTALTGPYCHACGQAAHVHRTLSAIGHDLLHGVLHFEGKIWRTLPLLALNPGALTRRYIQGERARFVSPLALFLFGVFLVFATFSAVGGHVGGGPAIAVDGRPPADGRRVIESAKIELGSGVIEQRVRKALADPDLLAYKLQANAYKFAWALIPLSVPFVWLLFARRREYRLYDHTIFVTYSLAGVLFLLVAVMLTGAMGLDADLLWLLVPVHMFLQLKGAYRLTTGSALWRTALLSIFAVWVMLAFGIGLLALGTV